jgi:penicillin-binding protein 2
MSTHFAPDDRRNLTTRLSLLQGAIAVVFALLAIGFWVFQVAQHQKFREMAENNHTRRLPMPAPRGILFDRHGTVLVDNQYMYNITLDREQSRNIGETLRVLERATGVPEADLRETLNRRRGEPSYRPLVLIENATEAQVIAMLARRSDLPGVSFENLPTRKYPASDMAAHLFGYVSEVNEAQLSRPEYEGLEAGARV